jgi:hypothetical protein
MLPAKFGSILPRTFRGENLFNISQSETRIGFGSHICWPNGMNRLANKYGCQEKFLFLIG